MQKKKKKKLIKIKIEQGFPLGIGQTCSLLHPNHKTAGLEKRVGLRQNEEGWGWVKMQKQN